MTYSITVLLLLVSLAAADVYLHNPRGSNNRNCRNDNNDRRRNGNRLFDSQNNDKGGYSCPRAYPFTAANTGDTAVVNEYGKIVSSASGSHIDTKTFYYYEGTQVSLEWTTQHGCGDTENINCRIVIQYMCDTEAPEGTSDYLSKLITNKYLRDGTPVNNNDNDNTNDEATTTIPEEANAANCNNNGNLDPPNCALDGRFGYQESQEYYQWCKLRQRNYGLFTADQLPVQNKNSNTRAINTRQNPNGNRRGLECPEERDYYPYWHPSPWKDAAVGVPPRAMAACEEYVKESQNVVDKCFCDLSGRGTPIANQATQEAECITQSGVWTCAGKWGLAPPICFPMSYSRDNHLGNAANGRTHSMNWTLPSLPNGKDTMRCVMRLRYNATTGDFPETLDAASNCNPNDNACTRSPIADRENREALTYVQLFDEDEPDERRKLSLAVNTDQYARTFQDRTYAFDIKRVPSNVKDMCKNGIANVNVRGKRGNIVQTYPSVEYDFAPQDLVVEQEQCIHMQWIGSDYNPNRNPNNGEGGPPNPNNINEAKADRTNLVQYASLGHNHPLKASEVMAPFFMGDNGDMDWDLHKKFAFLGQDYEDDCDSLTVLKNRNPNDRQARERDPRNCAKLNGAKTPYFDGGVFKVKAKTGSYKFMSTRNNNFSNRSQKLKIDVVPCTSCGGGLTQAQVAGVVLGVFVGVAVVAVVGIKYMSSRHPERFAAMKASMPKLSSVPASRVPAVKAKPQV